ncbi:MAG: hypothetical protein ABIB43_00865 [archaeon]
MEAGRPTKSEIRQNIVELLKFMGKAYGYEIHKIYLTIFPKASQRIIYYHLKKGLDTGEFEVENIRFEEGEYSWGKMAEKKYYKLGPNAIPRISARVKKYFDKKNKL